VRSKNGQLNLEHGQETKK